MARKKKEKKEKKSKEKKPRVEVQEDGAVILTRAFIWAAIIIVLAYWVNG